MIEAGSKVNWTALESGVVDRIFFYYAPKILGGLEALPLAGGIGRRRRSDAIQLHGIDDPHRSRRTNSPWRDTSMFTGIVEELGTVEALMTRAAGARLTVRCATVLEDMTEGASIAVNGVCLTAVDPRPGLVLTPTWRPRRCAAATWATCAPARASTWSARSRPRAA